MDQYKAPTPPEVREIGDPLRLVEFYIGLDDTISPEADMLELMSEWMHRQSPTTMVGVTFNYTRPTNDQSSMLVGMLVLNSPMDFG